MAQAAVEDESGSIVMKPRVYYFTTSTFAGLAPGARHIYARIRWAAAEGPGSYDSEDLERDGLRGFESKEDAQACAVEWFKANRSTDLDLLVAGDPAICAPKKILIGGTPDLVEAVRQCVEEDENLGAIEHAERRSDGEVQRLIDRCFDRWEAILKEFVR